MAKRSRLHGFGLEEVEERFPEAVELTRRRHGNGLGLRPSRYVGKHRGPSETNGHKPAPAEGRRGGKASDFGFRKANDFGFGS